MAPCVSVRPKLAAISSVTSWMPTPSQPRRFPELGELFDHRLGEVARHGKADAERGAAFGDDGGVDADHLAVHVEQRAAGIALVDRGVGLDVAVVRAGLDVAVACRTIPSGDRTAEPERVADRHHPVADLGGVAVAELDERQRVAGVDLQQRQVGLAVGADDRRRENAYRR